MYLDSLALGDLARFPACFGAHLSNVFVAESPGRRKAGASRFDINNIPTIGGELLPTSRSGLVLSFDL